MYVNSSSEGPFPAWALAVFAGVFLLNLAHWLICRHQLQSTGGMKAKLVSEIADLKREAARLNTPSTFASCAKCQRQAAAKEKQLAALDANNGADKQLDMTKAVLGYSKIALAAVVTVIFWGHHMVDLPVFMSWPMNRTLSVPHGSSFSTHGFVAALPWYMVCNRASNLVIQAMLPAIMHKPANKPSRQLAQKDPLEKKNL